MSNSATLFERMKNAVLDLQAAELQTFEKPLRTLARVLREPLFAEKNAEITDGLDLEEFLRNSENSGSGLGSRKLSWPDDPLQELGMTLLLIEWLAEDGNRVVQLGFKFFGTNTKVIYGIRAVVSQVIVPFIRDYRAFMSMTYEVPLNATSMKSKKIFIVHGHDVEARESLARFIAHIGLEPIILHEQANRGRTVIEKVEALSDVSFAVILLTPDDVGRANGEDNLEPRARQNVLLELGYFYGRLGRPNVCALMKGDVFVPSDFAGVVWEQMDAKGAWKMAIARELKAAGHEIDWNKVMS